jgi:chromate transporter
MSDSTPRSRANWNLILKIFLVTFRIGLFTFGGGGSLVLMMQHEFVERRGWIERDVMVDVLAVARSLPGGMAVNTSILAGYRICGAAGGIAAGLGSVVPSFLVISVFTLFYTSLIRNEFFLGAIRGIRGVVLALLLATVYRLRKQSILDIWGILIFGLAFCILVFFQSVNVIFIIIGGFSIGIALYYRRIPKSLREEDGGGAGDV